MKRDRRPTFFRRTLSGLVPCERGAEDALRRVPMGDIVRVEIKKARNIRHHAKYWKLLDIVAENLDGVTPEVLHEVVKLRTGHVRVVQTKRGFVEIPDSISFHRMDQTEFSAFYDRAVAFIVSDVLPGVGRQELEDAVLEMVA